MSKIKFPNIANTYNKYLDNLYSYGINLGFNDHVVMDAIHDVFFKLCTQHSSLDKIENLKFYLFRSLRNRLIDIKRTNREFPSTSAEIIDDLPFQLSVTIEDDLIKREDALEIKQKVQEFLTKLTPRQREVIYLRYMSEYSYDEIADIMQISIAATRNLVSKSISKLREIPLAIPFILLLLK